MKTPNTYAIFLIIDGEKKKFEQDAESIYDAIDSAKAKHGGKFWLAYETAESQKRH